jgi:cytochrome c-type biogenesis protein CcmH/NrfG
MLYLARGGDLGEAERLALRALAQKGPLQPYVLDTLAHVYARQGRFKEAVAALEKAEAAAPSHDKILHERLIRLRNQLVDNDSQEDRTKTEKPGVRQNPERNRDGVGQEFEI